MKVYFEQTNRPHSVLVEDDFRDMIKMRKIDSADFAIIEKLSCFPKSLFIEYHNFFLFSKENTLHNMERDLDNFKSEIHRIRQKNDMEYINLLENRIAFLSLFIEFAKKYDWTVCNNLNRVFERRKIKK